MTDDPNVSNPRASKRNWTSPVIDLLGAAHISRGRGDVVAAALFILAAVFVLPRWYRGEALIWGPDATAFPPLTLRNIGTYFEVVDPGLGVPHVRKFPFLLPLGALFAAYANLHLPYEPEIVQRGLVLLLLWCSGISSYLLIRRLLPSLSTVAALGGGLFYMFNLYTAVTNWSNTPNLLFHYSFLPLVVGMWFLAHGRESIRLALLSSIVWSLTLTPAYTTTPVVLTDFLLLLGVTVFHLKGRQTYRTTVGITALITIAWLAINLYWLVPLAFYFNTESLRGLAAGSPLNLFRANSAPIGDAVRLAGYWALTSGHNGSPYFPWWFSYQGGLGTLTWLLPILAGCGVLWGIRGYSSDSTTRKHLLFFAVVLGVALTLMAGTKSPVGSLLQTLMERLDLVGPFRSVYQRFGVYVAFSYAPLVAAGFDAVTPGISRLSARPTSRLLASLTTLALICLLAFSGGSPMWTGELFNRSGVLPARRISFPPAYLRAAEWLDQQPGDFVTMAFPHGPSPVTVLSWKHGSQGYRATEPLQLLSTKPLLLEDLPTSYLKPLVRSVAQGGSRTDEALALLNVRYIALHLDANRGFLRGLGGWIGRDVQALDRSFDRSRILELAFDSPQLRIYEVMTWRPHSVYGIRSYQGQSIYSKAMSIETVSYRRLSPAQFEIPAAQLRRGDVLVVNHPFDPLWRANGARPFRLAPGLTAFRVDSDRHSFVVYHALDRWYRWLPRTSLLALALSLLLSLLSRKRFV